MPKRKYNGAWYAGERATPRTAYQSKSEAIAVAEEFAREQATPMQAESEVIRRYLAEKDDPMCECDCLRSRHCECGRCKDCQCPDFVAAEPFEDKEAREV